jgi:hypothetical protein
MAFHFGSKIEVKEYTRTYIPTYLLFIGFILVAFVLGSFKLIEFTPEAIVTITSLFLVWCLFTRPYKAKFDMLGESVNLTLVIIVGIWIVAKKYSSTLASVKSQFLFVAIGLTPLMVLSLTLSFVRTIKGIR